MEEQHAEGGRLYLTAWKLTERESPRFCGSNRRFSGLSEEDPSQLMGWRWLHTAWNCMNQISCMLKAVSWKKKVIHEYGCSDVHVSCILGSCLEIYFNALIHKHALQFVVPAFINLSIKKCDNVAHFEISISYFWNLQVQIYIGF